MANNKSPEYQGAPHTEGDHVDQYLGNVVGSAQEFGGYSKLDTEQTARYAELHGRIMKAVSLDELRRIFGDYPEFRMSEYIPGRPLFIYLIDSDNPQKEYAIGQFVLVHDMTI